MENYEIAENLQLIIYSGEEISKLKIMRTNKYNLADKYLVLNNLHIGNLRKVNTGSNCVYLLFINRSQVHIGTEKHCIEVLLQHLKQ